MAIYNFTNNSLKKFETTTFNVEGILERQHLQATLKHQIDVVAPDCLIISEEFSEWSGSQRRIDLLAIDKQANLVVIELKRTETGEQMELQALRYAAMVSTLTFSRASEIFQKYLLENSRDDNATNLMVSFLGWDEPQEDNFALDVRIILVSSNFSKELTTSVMWLNQRNLDIRCIRLIPYKYEDKIFIDVQQIIPLPEIESYQIKIKQQSEERREARNSSRDYTNYVFKGNSYNKRKLVLAIIQYWVSENTPDSYNELTKVFPNDLKSGGIFSTELEAIDIYDRQNIYRHFLGEDEVLKFSDSTRYVISNQWGKENILKFISHVKTLGYQVEESS